MILYGCAVTDGETFARFAEPGIRRLTDAEPDSELLAQPSAGSIVRNYNLLRDRAAEREDLEALVLLHQDVEIVDPGVLRGGPRRRSPTRASRSPAAPGRSASAASPGGRAR